MKARCVDNTDYENILTVGNIYEVDVDGEGRIDFIAEDELSHWGYGKMFELLPDEPAPKSDWMRCFHAGDQGIPVDNIAGWKFDPKSHTVEIFLKQCTAQAIRGFIYVKTDADAFAELVDYDWSESAR